RYPRGSGTGVVPDAAMQALARGKGIIRGRGNHVAGQRVALLALGAPLSQGLQAAEALDGTVGEMRVVQPLDHGVDGERARQHDVLVTLEDNAIQGGAGSAVLESLATAGLSVPVLTLGIPDRYIEHASPAQQQQDIGLDVAGILAAVAGYRSRTGAS